MNLSDADIDKLSADELLKMREPESLFPRDEDGITHVFRTLSKKWHPDRNPGDAQAESVFKNIAELKTLAEDHLKNNRWHEPGLLELTQKSGKTARIHYLIKHDFELGEFYICQGKLAYVVKPEFSDLFENAVKTIKGLKFPNDKMRAQLTPQLPQYYGRFETADGHQVMILERDDDMILLRDLLDNEGGKIEAPHVAWIMSRLHNMTCYLQWAGIAHNGITLDSVFVLPKDRSFARTPAQPISPKDHTMGLLGGWWYAAQEGRPLLGLPSQAVNYAPRAVIDEGRADRRIDHTLIRIVGRELLGDITGVKLARDKDVPKPIADWLALPGSGDAMQDFETWQKQVLGDSFGARKFVEMDVDSRNIYKPQP